MSIFRRSLLVLQEKEKTLPNYLCFTALESGTFTLTLGASLKTTYYSYIEYSTDNGNTWIHTDNETSVEVVVTTPTIQSGGTVLWRGIGTKTCQDNSGDNKFCAVFSSTCNYNASGILMSILVADNINDNMSRNTTYLFSRLFFDDIHIVDASNMILPKATANNAFDRFFSGCTHLTKSPLFLATTINGNYAYRGLYYNCTALIQATTLPALSLKQGSYYTMFYGCKALEYVKMLATDISASNSLYLWMKSVPNKSTSVFVKHIDATWTTTGDSGVLTNWTIIYYDPNEDKYYTSQDKLQECDDHGNPL